MNIDLKEVLKNKAINEWRLFWLISIPMSITIVIAMMGHDMSTAHGVSEMISFAVRWAVPFIFLVVAISSLQILFPGPFPMWLLRNRKYIGMCFAVAMAWQGSFILIMSNFFREYYFTDYVLRDELEGSIGYIFLSAMVVTSFRFGRKYLNQKQWKLLHKSSLYFLWAYAFSVYWWALFYYPYNLNPRAIDYVLYWCGFLAFALRIVAWGKQRQQAVKRNAPESSTPLAFKVLGSAFIAFGLFVSATQWQESVTAFLTAPKWSENLVLWLPYWPFEPFLSLFIIGLGAMLVTKVKT